MISARYDDFRARFGGELVAFCVSGDRGEAQQFMREIAAPFRNAYDRGLQSVAWGVSGLPTAIRLDAAGRIVERDVFAPRYLSDS